jgi:hypothetical protein
MITGGVSAVLGNTVTQGIQIASNTRKTFSVPEMILAGGAGVAGGALARAGTSWLESNYDCTTKMFSNRLARFVGRGMEAYLDACFAAGTPLLGEHGSRPIEAFRPGDRVLSRDQSDPDGPPELKRVEEVFARAGRVWHLHVGGQVLRTTGEHPFFCEREGTFVPARELRPGDRIPGHDGGWSEVEEVYDTGAYETVYNMRVADFHTYFVGCDQWGFSVWAHNARCAVVEDAGEFKLVDREGRTLYQAKTFGEVADFATESGHTLAAGSSRAFATPEQRLIAALGDDIVSHNGQLVHSIRLQDHVGDAKALHAMLNKEIPAALPDHGVIYMLRDRVTGEVFKPGQTTTSMASQYKSAMDVRVGQYLSNQRDLRAVHGLNVDVEVIYAFTRQGKGQLNLPESTLRTALGGDSPTRLLWENGGSRLLDAQGNTIRSGTNPNGLPYRNADIRDNWLRRAGLRGFNY